MSCFYRYFLQIMCLLVLLGCHDTSPKNVKVVEVEAVALKNIQETVQFIGTIRAERQTVLVAKTRGILDRVVAPGAIVKSGALIARIENDEAEHSYKLSQNIEKIAQVQHERLNQLLKSGASSKAAVEEKQGQLAESQKRLAEAKRAFEDTNISAPFDGIVGVFKVREGAQVQEGDALVVFYDPSSTIVEFNVPLSIARLVQDGAPVFIQNRVYPLTHVQRMLDEATHMSPAYVHIECKGCIMGATTEVKLVVRQKTSVVVIPYEAVFLRNGKPHVYRVQAGKVALTPITLGLRERQMTEVVSGLKKGDQVVLRGQARLYPEAPVKVVKGSGS